jgi:hypothetical protein
MKGKLGLAAAVFAFAIGLSGIANAQTAPRDGDGNVVTGWHWNLNIICVPESNKGGKKLNQGGTLFVPCDGDVDISYTLSDDDKFHIIDGNGLDGDAEIAVPYEYCGDYSSGGCADLVAFDVYATGLGKPLGEATIDATCVFEFGDDTVNVIDQSRGGTSLDAECTDTLLLDTITIKRTNGGKNKPLSVDITDIFRASGCFDGYDDIDGGDADGDNEIDGICNKGDLKFNRIWVFNIEELDSYLWAYQNDGLKLMQVRFYPSDDSGSIEIL